MYNSKLFFTAEAIVCLFFGLTLTFTTDNLVKEYMINAEWLNDGLMLVGAAYGTLLLACAIAYWTARGTSNRPLLLLACISNICLVVLHSKGILSGVETTLTWGTVLLCAFFGVWSALILMKKEN